MLGGLRIREDAEPNRSIAHYHLIDAFNALSGLHSFAVNAVGARQCQHPRGSSPLTEEGRPPKNEKGEDEEWSELRDVLGGTI